MIVDRARVGDVLQLQRREVDVDITATYREIGVRSFGRGIFHKEPVSGLDLGNKRVFSIEPGDLVLSNVFAWEGAIALAGPLEQGLIGSHRFMTYRPVDDRVDAAWASWFFVSEPGLRLLREASPGSAGRNRTLAIDRFEDLVIPLPSLDEQRRVAARLSTAGRACGRLRELVDESQTIGLALSESVAARLDLNPDEKSAAGWQQVQLGDVLRLSVDEVKVEQTGEYESAGVYSFGKGLFRRPVLRGADTSYNKLHRLHREMIVMSRLKAWEGALALVGEEFDGACLSPEFPTFTVTGEGVSSEYLGLRLASPSFWQRLGGASRGIGARRERVRAERLLEQQIDIPPLEVQEEMLRVIRKLEDRVSPQEARNQRLQALLPAALNEAFAAVS